MHVVFSLFFLLANKLAITICDWLGMGGLFVVYQFINLHCMWPGEGVGV